MANTLSVMTNVLRNVVSKQRIRYKEKGFNLDLAYVCDNIIAMGYPAEKYESMYRNRLEDVQKFLEENHRDHYKIYNLCLERSYDISKFHGRVSVYPFEDHNPPTIELIQQFCEDVDSWLKADPLNVAAVHCKAGKGRTGTMICCYLLYSGQQRTADDALACYDEKRTKDRKGVTIPSQRRYVQYFSKLIRMGLSYCRRSLQFCEIRFLGANALQSQGSVHCTISVLEDKVKPLAYYVVDFRKQSVLDVKITVSGDIKVELTKNTKKLFHFWFNTFFVTDSVIEGDGNDEKYIYTLNKCEIDDAHKDKEHKCFSEDFKVVLVFYVDGSNAVRDGEKSSSGQSFANHRQSVQSGPANTCLPTIQSNNYSLPQNNSSGSEMNFICDQQSSSSTSVSSSLGGATTDNSNGYESNSKRNTQHRSGVQNFGNIHHSHPYVAMHDENSVSYASPPPQPVATIGAPPGYVVEHERLQAKNQHCIQKNNMHHLQQKHVPSVTATSTPNQRHIQRQNAGTVAGSNADGSGILDIHRGGTDISCPTSANLNASGISSSANYNHSTHNSSKTSSVSSQSSSVVGDNEEDWESGESSAKQLDHITLLLSTSSVTSSPAPKQILPNNNTNTNLSPNDSSRSKQKINVGLQPSSSTSSSSSTSASSSTCTSASQSSISSKSSSQCPYNKCNTSSSSCINRVAGGDDDDDNENVDESKPKFKISDSNIVATQEQEQQLGSAIGATGVSLESGVRDVKKTNTARMPECCDRNSNALTLSTPAQTPSSRPKFMHLLMLPKNNNSHQSTHKPIFKRKSSYKLTKNVSNTTGLNASNDGCRSSTADTTSLESASVTPDTVLGNMGGVATTSKQKLKIKLKKNKLKFSQKFQWFRSYFRSDPVDFCENFVQQTTSIRRNSICSMASRTHKLSTTTPPSITPPPPPLAGANIDGSSSCEQLNDRGPGSVSGSTSNASIATGDHCEDYYSHICDNQLSFSNSPCKSPRSMADIVGSISGSGGGHGGSFGSSFAHSAGSFHQQYFRERQETLPGLSSHSARRNNVVIVAAKPVRTNAIGFNIHTATCDDQQSQAVRQDSPDFNASPASVYNTASCSPPLTDECVADSQKETKNIPFVFPVNVPNKAPENSSGDSPSKESPTKTQTKYSLNLVIVKECPSDECAATAPGNISKTSRRDGEICHDPYSDFSCEQDRNEFTIMHTSNEGDISGPNATSTAIDDLFETKTTATTSASICSNSSSSGFCTSECCTTNSSSSSCNCNPFALGLERHVALAALNTAKQADPKQDIILEVEVEHNDTALTTDPSMPPGNPADEASHIKPESNEHKCD